MMRDLVRPALSMLPLLVSAAGCVSLSYDEPQDAAATTAVADSSHRRETPTRARLARRDADDPGAEAPRDWRELTQLARESAQSGELDRASELLAQAALQLEDRKPTNAQRRTVFGLRARLAHDLAALGRSEQADALADALFDEVRAEPELGDAAFVTLARATAARRREAAREAGRAESQLPILQLAFDTAQTGTASRERLALAFEVSGQALREGDLELARRAIDQAIIDTRILAPADDMQAAALKVFKARIALAQRDLEAAEASASAAVRIFEEAKADGSNRGVAEATLAQVLAEKGERERALELGRAAYARLSGPEELVPHARRQIASRLARIEALAGERDAAGAHYREALAVPDDGTALDRDLIREIKSALGELETTKAAPPAAS